jgi:RsiW-degrading membrane proteinase PrsW (M82 family)
VVYAWGQGMHVAANSINNARPGQTAHLWDEIVGHLVWYAGTALVGLALARTMPGRARCGPVGYVLALAVGLTWASNAAGGHTELLSLAVAILAAWFGWRHRRELGETLLVGFLPSAIVIVVVLTPLL